MPHPAYPCPYVSASGVACPIAGHLPGGCARHLKPVAIKYAPCKTCKKPTRSKTQFCSKHQSSINSKTYYQRKKLAKEARIDRIIREEAAYLEQLLDDILMGKI